MYIGFLFFFVYFFWLLYLLFDCFFVVCWVEFWKVGGVMVSVVCSWVGVKVGGCLYFMIDWSLEIEVYDCLLNCVFWLMFWCMYEDFILVKDWFDEFLLLDVVVWEKWWNIDLFIFFGEFFGIDGVDCSVWCVCCDWRLVRDFFFDCGGNSVVGMYCLLCFCWSLIWVRVYWLGLVFFFLFF